MKQHQESIDKTYSTQFKLFARRIGSCRVRCLTLAGTSLRVLSSKHACLGPSSSPWQKARSSKSTGTLLLLLFLFCNSLSSATAIFSRRNPPCTQKNKTLSLISRLCESPKVGYNFICVCICELLIISYGRVVSRQEQTQPSALQQHWLDSFDVFELARLLVFSCSYSKQLVGCLKTLEMNLKLTIDLKMKSIDDVLSPLPSSRSNNSNTLISPLVYATRNHRERHQSWRIACRLAERAEDVFEESLWNGKDVEEAQIRARIAREEEEKSRNRVDAAAMRILHLKRRKNSKKSNLSSDSTASTETTASNTTSSTASIASTQTSCSSISSTTSLDEQDKEVACIRLAQRVPVDAVTMSPASPSLTLPPSTPPTRFSCGCVGACFCSAVSAMFG